MKKVIIIGAGPAGMMAAISSAGLGNSVLLLEKNSSPGKKLLITGKGRCNITNAVSLDEFISRFSKNAQFLRDAFNEFFVEDIFDFFEKRGLMLKKERQSRVFPCTDSATSILAVLKKEMARLNVHISYKTKVKDIILKDCRAAGVRLSSNKIIPADGVIIATGGASYGFTGSTGDGYSMAGTLGHIITPIRPALVSLRVKQSYVKQLEGISLKNVQLTFKSNKTTFKSDIGELLFTDKGVSGPLVISMSADMLDVLDKNGLLELAIDLKPALEIKQLEMRILREISAAPKKTIFNLLKTLLPVRLAGLPLQLLNISRDIKTADITADDRRKVISFLKAWKFEISGSAGMEKAMITRGGIRLKDIDPKTMQSRIVKGLYFAGEIIDVDADTGGFNLQAAFSTGYLAGRCC